MPSINPARLPRNVHPSIAGDTRIPITELRRKLGRTAFAVWRDMVLHRSTDGGLFYGTLANIAKRIGKSEVAVRHAMKRRLLRSGLVLDMGKRWLSLPRGRVLQRVQVRARTVFGAYMTEHVVTVPYEVAVWVNNANPHGGRLASGLNRNDAMNTRGTPSGPVTSTPSGPVSDQHPWSAAMGATDPPSGPVTPPNPTPSGPPDRCYREEGETKFGLKPERAPDEPAHASSDSFLFRSEVEVPGGTERKLGRPKNADVSPIVCGGVVPPYPGRTLVRAPTIPKPPLLSSNMTDVELARALVKAYNAACGSRLGAKNYSYVRGDIQKARPFKQLVEAARVMVEKEISPWGWCAWRLDEHIAKGRTDRPPITVVYSLRMIHHQGLRNVYRRAATRYGGRTFMPPSLRTLLVKYRHMQEHIHQSAINNEEDLAVIVNEHFPPGAWGLLVDAAQKEAHEAQVQFTRALNAGEFIW